MKKRLSLPQPLCILCLSCLISIIKASADTHYVSLTGGNNYPYTSWSDAATGIQDAVNAASDGDIVLIADGTYSPADQIEVWRAVTVKSQNGVDAVIIDGGGVVRCFMLQNMDAVLEGLTITNGNASSGGGVNCYYGGLVTNCLIVGNRATYGGGVDCNLYGRAVDCTIRGNHADVFGGGAYCSDYSDRGGIMNSLVCANHADLSGGGVYCDWGGRVAGSVISNNTITTGMGVGVCVNGGRIVESTVVDNHTATGNGGGIFVMGWQLSCGAVVPGRAESCTVQGNSALAGGGIVCEKFGIVSNCTVQGNSAAMGGGMYTVQTNLVVSCTMIGNSAGQGGGLYIEGGDFPVLNIVNGCTFRENHAIDGGGVYFHGTNSVMRNCVMYDNVATNGGGVCMTEMSNFVENCTIVANEAAFGGGIFCTNAGEVVNTIIYFNNAEFSGSNWYLHGPVQGSHISFYDCCSAPQIFPEYGTGNFDDDPALSNVASRNFLLLPDSPCRNVGREYLWMTEPQTWADIPRDREMKPRLVGGVVDIGAYEIQAALPPACISAGDGVDIGYLRVSWCASADATKYKLYRATSSKLRDAVVIHDNITSTTYVDGVVLPGVYHYYWVKAGNEFGWSEFSDYDRGYAKLLPPTHLSATDGTFFDEVVITWDHCNRGSTWYTLYRNMSNDTNTMGEVVSFQDPWRPPPEEPLSPKWDDSGLILGVTYYYWVRAAEPGGATSELTQVETGWVAGQIPDGVAASDGAYKDKVRITWNTCTNALSYAVCRNTSNNVAGAQLLDERIVGTMYEDTTAVPGLSYYYWVKAEYPAGMGDPSVPDEGYARLLPPSLVSATDGAFLDKVVISWNNVSIVATYTVYRNTANTTNGMTLIASTGATTCEDFDVIDKQLYYYWIQAHAPADDSELSNNDVGWAGLIPHVDVHYVSLSGGNIPPYGSWEDAAIDIRSAVLVASDGDTVVITNGTYETSAQIDVWRAITVKSVNGPEATVVDGRGDHRCFTLQNMDAVIEGLTISNGYVNSYNNAFDAYGGGIYCYYGGLISNCVLVGNAADQGGGLYCSLYGRFMDGVIRGNSASNSGGGAYCQSNSFRGGIIRSIITENLAISNGGGGVFCDLDGIVTNCTLSGNSIAAGVGGGACISGGRVIGCTITDNHAPTNGGGGVYVCGVKDAPGVVETCIISGNSATNGGGVLCDAYGIVTNCVVQENSAPQGGGIHARNVCRVVNNTIVSNSAGNGGGLYIDTGSIVNNCVVRENSAYYGGGVCMRNPEAVIRNSLILHNEAVYGGGVYASDKDDTVENCTIVTNNAQYGGGVYCDHGGIFVNSIIYYNSAVFSGTNWYLHGTVGESYISFNNCCTMPRMFPEYGVSNIVEAPAFIDLDGGDYDIASNSPCINAGINADWMSAPQSWMDVSRDLDGDPRLVGEYVDIGAYEFQAPLPPGGVTATDGTYADYVLVTWAKPIGATKYRVYRSEQNDETTATLIGDNVVQTNFYDNTITPGVLYYYWLSSGNQIGWSELSLPDSGYARMLPPSNVSATDGTYIDKVVVSWTASGGAQSYTLYRYTSNDTNGMSELAITAGTSYEDMSISLGVLYYYWVRANGAMATSELSVSDSGFAGMDAPTDVSATDGAYFDKIVLTWTGSADATSYIIYRNIVNDSSTATQMATSANTTYTNMDVWPGMTYYYWVRSYSSLYDTYSVFSEPDAGYAALNPQGGLDASDGAYSNKVVLTWPAVSGAYQYKVYRSETNDNTTALQIGASVTTHFDDVNVVLGQLYYYWLKVTAAMGDSGFSPSDSGYAFYAPSGVQASDGVYTDRVEITWHSMPDALSYNVYRSTSASAESAALIGSATSPAYSDASVSPGVVYYYWVAGVSETVIGPLSTDDSGHTTLTASSSEWKYKHKNRYDILIGKRVSPSLSTYFHDGYMIALADTTATNYIDGPRKLESKRNGKMWKFKIKREVVVKYAGKKRKLVYKVWKTMPPSRMICIIPPESAGSSSLKGGGVPAPEVRILLVPRDPADTRGWRELVPEIIDTASDESQMTNPK